MPRSHNRTAAEARPVSLQGGFVNSCPHSVLIATGNTRVLCTASIENKAPRWMGSSAPSGWVTAEYNMLPNSSPQRIKRERGKVGGRTQEIQRLISRSLRAAVDLEKIPGYTIVLDCDVIEADGGTRTASISGAFVCLLSALESLRAEFKWEKLPVKGYLAAVSVGKVNDEILADLNYEEDSSAQVDCNIVALSGRRLVEVQSTAEEGSYTHDELTEMVNTGLVCIESMYEKQRECLQAMLPQTAEL